MPKYYFHLTASTRLADADGRDMPTESSAVQYAEMIASALGRTPMLVGSTIVVTDDNGVDLCEVRVENTARTDGSRKS